MFLLVLWVWGWKLSGWLSTHGKDVVDGCCGGCALEEGLAFEASLEAGFADWLLLALALMVVYYVDLSKGKHEW